MTSSDVQTSPAGTGPIVCGHRGAPAVSPENTLASFAAASDRGATWVEFDVRPTGDGQLAIHHDPATGDGVHLGTTPYAELDSSIPRFGDLVASAPHLGLDIEMKTDEIAMPLATFADLVIAEIEEHCASIDNLMVTSFDAQALQLVRQRRPDIATGFLFWKLAYEEAIDIAVAAGHGTIAPWIKLLDADVVSHARNAGLDVVTWTVNEPEQVALAASLGVDMIIGDDPAVIIENL